MDPASLVMQALLLAALPLLVGLTTGLDRKLTARFQNRAGPPIVQPLYDLFKLFGKRPLLLNDLQAMFACATLMFQATALAIFITGGDLLIAFFASGAGSICMVLGAFSARSPFAYIGGQRELIAIFAYEPVLFLVILAISLQRSLLVRDIGGGLIIDLPLVMLALIPVLVILLEKSPYDIPAAHQEIIGGPHVEYSGPHLAIMTLAKWFEIAFVYGILSLFIWSDNALISAMGKAAIVLAALFAVVLIDNITARLTRGRMVAFTLGTGTGLVAVNILVLHIFQGGVPWWG